MCRFLKKASPDPITIKNNDYIVELDIVGVKLILLEKDITKINSDSLMTITFFSKCTLKNLGYIKTKISKSEKYLKNFKINLIKILISNW